VIEVATLNREVELVGRVKFRIEWKVHKRSRPAFLIGFERRIYGATASTRKRRGKSGIE